MSRPAPRHKTHFLDFFPPPAFLERPTVGLSISDTRIRFFEYIKRGRLYRLGRFGERVLPPGTISGGYVNNKDEVRKHLEDIRVKEKLSFVRVSLPEEKAYLFKERIPAGTERDLRHAVEFTLEENVPLPASEVTFDFVVIDDEHAREGRREDSEVGVAVYPTKVVETYEEIIKGAGLTPLSFTTESEAVARAVVSRKDRSTVMIVNFSENRTGLYVVSAGVVVFSSGVEIGSAAITAAIAKHFSVSQDEAEEIKHRKGFIKDRKNMDLFFSLMNTVSALKDEIGKLSMYWSTHKDKRGESGKKIERMILCGKDAGLEGFCEYLALTMKMKVEVANVWINSTDFDVVVPPLPLLASLDYAAAAGAALPEEL